MASIRAASGRNPSEIRCQNPDCAAVLEVSSIPVEYEGKYEYRKKKRGTEYCPPSLSKIQPYLPKKQRFCGNKRNYVHFPFSLIYPCIPLIHSVVYCIVFI